MKYNYSNEVSINNIQIFITHVYIKKIAGMSVFAKISETNNNNSFNHTF